ncbi:MAG: hypothetical protein ACFFCY_10370 [Promethearchaeota archaeon]
MIKNHEIKFSNKETANDADDILKRKDIDLKFILYKIFGIILIMIGAIWMIIYNIMGYNYLISILWPSFEWLTRGLYIGCGILAIFGVIYGFHNEKLGYNFSIFGGFIPLVYALFIIVFIIFTMGFVEYYFYLLFFLSFIMSGILMGYLSQAFMILIGAKLVHKAQEYN